MGIEGIDGRKNIAPKTPLRLRLAIEAAIKFSVSKITITGKENLKEIQEGEGVDIITYHLSDNDVMLAASALYKDLDLLIPDQSVHHKFSGHQGEKPTNLIIKSVGESNFPPIDYFRNEKGDKYPKAFNPEDFAPMAKAMETGKSVVMSINNPSPSGKQLSDLKDIKGGYGAAYLALLTGKPILLVTVKLDDKIGMYKDNVTLKTLFNRPNASIAISKPLRVEKFKGMERFAELMRRRGSKEPKDKLNEKEREELLGLMDILREKSEEIMKLMSEQFNNQN